MKNVPAHCIKDTSDSIIKFEEKRSVIRFHNPAQHNYKLVKVDGCAITDGLKCDNLLCKPDETEERYVELKGTDIPHAIRQLRQTISTIGEHSDGRKAYIVSTRISPGFSTLIQNAMAEFKTHYSTKLSVRNTPVDVNLY